MPYANDYDVPKNDREARNFLVANMPESMVKHADPIFGIYLCHRHRGKGILTACQRVLESLTEMRPGFIEDETK